MVLSPSRREAGSFDLTEIHPQELQNLLEALEHSAPPWRWNSPWGRGTIRQFKEALEAGHKYFYNTSWR